MRTPPPCQSAEACSGWSYPPRAREYWTTRTGGRTRRSSKASAPASAGTTAAQRPGGEYLVDQLFQSADGQLGSGRLVLVGRPHIQGRQTEHGGLDKLVPARKRVHSLGGGVRQVQRHPCHQEPATGGLHRRERIPL